MSIKLIGKQIAALRKERGYKQEELAKAVGVSTQAVSKWENGGVPDTELLPSIANFFGVSIDYLFNRSVTDYADLRYALMRKIHEMSENERIKAVFNFCFDMERSAMNDPNKIETSSVEEYEKSLGENEERYSSMMFNNGFTLMGIANRSQYFLIVPDAKNSDAAYFNDINYIEFFMDFSDKSLFDACVFFHKRETGIASKAFTPSLLVKNLNVTQEKEIEIIEKLKKYSMIRSTRIEMDDEMQTVYTFNPTPSFVALLIFARELIDRPSVYSYFCANRKEPYLK